jgi:hypothetical protein
MKKTAEIFVTFRLHQGKIRLDLRPIILLQNYCNLYTRSLTQKEPINAEFNLIK